MIISELLDNPDETGIYPTTKCFEQLDSIYDKITSELAKGIKAKALRKKGTDDRWYWVFWGDDKREYVEESTVETYPLTYDFYDIPQNAELIDITIIIHEPKEGKE